MSDIKTPPGSAETTAPTTCEVAERVLGEIAWVNETEGYCECPGRHQHTSGDGRRDCKVYLDRVPTVYCLHASCASSLTRKNAELREAIRTGQPNTQPELSVREQKRLAQARLRCERLRTRAAKSLPTILRQHDWPLDKIKQASPVRIPEARHEQTQLLLRAFATEDTVWIGDRKDSGQQCHAVCFKTAAEWLTVGEIDGPLVCPVSFKPGSVSRSNDNVLQRRFLVVESDLLGKDEVGAVFRWLQTAVELPLVAIVDTAGKSLHAWFRWQNEDELDDFKLVLPALQCDPKLFTASQPVRLPGGLRDDRVQSLVYFDNGGAR
jgi:hypothetical protein